MSFAHQQLRSFVDRVLTLKKEQDKLGEDIKQVYAEAHAARFDKTAMGKVVNHLRRHAKAGAKAQIADATFEEYLEAYEHGTPLANIDTHTHAREALPPHDEDGVIIEEPVSVPSEMAAGQGGAAERQQPDGLALQVSSVAPPTNPQVSANGPMTNEDAPASGDAGEINVATPSTAEGLVATIDADASPNLSPSASPPTQAEQPSGIEPSPVLPEGAPDIDINLDIPSFLRRGDPACVVRQS